MPFIKILNSLFINNYIILILFHNQKKLIMKLDSDTIVNTALAIVIGAVVYKVLDKLFLDAALTKMLEK